VKLTTHLKLVPRSRKCGCIHPHTPSWRSALLVQHRNNFTCTLIRSHLHPSIAFPIRHSTVILLFNARNRGKVSPVPWRLMREWRYSSTILDLVTRRRLSVRFTTLPPLPPEKHHPVLITRLGRPQNRSARCAEGKILPLPRIETRPSSPVAHRYTDWAILTEWTTQLKKYSSQLLLWQRLVSDLRACPLTSLSNPVALCLRSVTALHWRELELPAADRSCTCEGPFFRHLQGKRGNFWHGQTLSLTLETFCAGFPWLFKCHIATACISNWEDKTLHRLSAGSQ
jgi:hypothetical protein